jgi:hypothetical protein
MFQRATGDGALIRVHLDGGDPTLPPPPPETTATGPDGQMRQADPESGFWSDYIPPDD